MVSGARRRSKIDIATNRATLKSRTQQTARGDATAAMSAVASWWNSIIEWLLSIFWRSEMEVCGL
jgi:hypothetical protein